jgi:inositol-phosphate phosphatase/L-galactose 1-phosphate phosphatase/histidinol-phosphatase
MRDSVDSYLALAEDLANAASQIIRRHIRTPVSVDDKADASPVTVADRDAEAAMRTMIESAFPNHGIVGEEFGVTRGGASHLWVLDPIDGTKSFVTGRPLFGSLIALCRDGRPIIGVIDCPAVAERWTAASGRPTLHQGHEARTRPCPNLAKAWLYCTSPQMFEAGDFERFDRVRRAVKFPLYGGDCYAYGLVASGFADLVIEAGLSAYDWAALVPVLEGAGGRCTDWRGNALDLATPKSRIIAAGDSRVHRAGVEILSS